MMGVSDGAPHWQRSHLMNDIPALQNRDLPPTADLIEDALGDTCPIWERFLKALEDPDLRVTVSWRWYVDGGWLGKVMRGTRNFAWLSLWVGVGRVTVYFPEAHRALLVDLDLSETLRARTLHQPPVGTSVPVSIDLRTDADLDDALTVLRHKLTLC